MSIFPMNHAPMEHSQVTRSTSMGEDMIHQYVLACVESIQTILFLSSSWFTSHLKGSQGWMCTFMPATTPTTMDSRWLGQRSRQTRVGLMILFNGCKNNKEFSCSRLRQAWDPFWIETIIVKLRANSERKVKTRPWDRVYNGLALVDVKLVL